MGTEPVLSKTSDIAVSALERDLIVLSRARGKQEGVATERPLYVVFVNGNRCLKDEREILELREQALRNGINLYADDVHNEFILCGESENRARPLIRKGESLEWKALLALLERVGGYWSHKDLFEYVARKPCEGVGDSRKAYQWVRHIKELLDEALGSLKIGKRLLMDVEQVFDTRSAPGRTYISGRVSACVIRHPAAS
jgi:hypothetical protein